MMWQHFDSLDDYCATDSYRQWLATWHEPSWPVDTWIDSEQQQWQWTPRQHGLTRWSTRLAHHLLASIAVQDHATVDIGCGENLFASAYSTVTGVAPRFTADAQLTDSWWQHNQGVWPRAYALNSLHFVTEPQHLEGQLQRVISTLASQGRALVTVNRNMIPQADQLWQLVPQWSGIERAVWIDTPSNAPVDGNCWFWLKR